MSTEIHPTAIVDPHSELGAGVSIGPYTIVHGAVRLGDGARIGSHCEIGLPTLLGEGRRLVVGAHAHIRSHSVLYQGSTLGDGLVTGHHVVIRELTEAGRGLQVGTYGDVQGHCRIGDHVRMHSGVQINHRSRIGNFVWLFPHVVLANDPHPPSNVLEGVVLEDYVAIAAMSLVLPGVVVGEGALVGANSTVTRDVPAETVVAGTPARHVCGVGEIMLRDGSGRPAYPWRRHFHRGYPPDVVERWLAEAGGRAEAP